MGIGETDQAKIVADPKPPLSERRRLQNRIAQRKFRERRAQSRKLETEFTFDVWSGPSGPACDADAGYPSVLGGGTECADDALGHPAGAPYSSPDARMGGYPAYLVRSPEALDAPYPGYCAPPPVVFTPDASPPISLPASLSPDPSSAALAALTLSDYRTPTTAPMTASGVLTPVGDDDSGYHALQPCTLGLGGLSISPTPSTTHTHGTATPPNTTTTTTVLPPNTTTTTTVLPPTPVLTPSPTAAAAYDLNLPASSSPSSSTGATATPLLHVAARARNRCILASLLKHGYRADERDAATGRTALHVAAGEVGDEALVALLLRYGADPHAADAQGHTPLFLAVAAGHGEVVEVLLEAGKGGVAGGGGGGGGAAAMGWGLGVS